MKRKSIIGINEFIIKKSAMGHDLRDIKFYRNEQFCTHIIADFTDKTLTFENYTDFFLYRAFGNNMKPHWEDFMDLLEERCIPKERAGLRYYLDALGLDEYDPVAIVEKTMGRMAEDHHWLTIERITCV